VGRDDLNPPGLRCAVGGKTQGAAPSRLKARRETPNRSNTAIRPGIDWSKYFGFNGGLVDIKGRDAVLEEFTTGLIRAANRGRLPF
jgi:hypothetical protein